MFRKTISIDGTRSRSYYRTMEAAKSHLPNLVWEYNGKYNVENMKHVDVQETDTYFGIIASGRINDEIPIQEFRLEIEKINFEPVGGYFAALIYNSGYANDIIYGNESLAEVQAYADTEAEAKELAKNYDVVKSWEVDCGACGYSGPFLSVRMFPVNR